MSDLCDQILEMLVLGLRQTLTQSLTLLSRAASPSKVRLRLIIGRGQMN
jgi:hypothetical protein